MPPAGPHRQLPSPGCCNGGWWSKQSVVAARGVGRSLLCLQAAAAGPLAGVLSSLGGKAGCLPLALPAPPC